MSASWPGGLTPEWLPKITSKKQAGQRLGTEHPEDNLLGLE